MPQSQNASVNASVIDKARSPPHTVCYWFRPISIVVVERHSLPLKLEFNLDISA